MALVFPPEPHGLHPHPYSADREASCPSSDQAAHEDASRPGRRCRRCSAPAGTPWDLSVWARSETFPFWDPVSSLREEGAGLE